MNHDLPDDECHVWLAPAPEVLPPSTVDRCEAWLTDDEWARYRSFRFERHRYLYLLTRGLVRATLSKYAAVHPAAWRFAVGPHGKPHIEGPSAAPPLTFNVSNTEGMVACAVARAIDVGIDVEHTERLDDPVSIADWFFSPREVRDLRALAPSRRRERFFAYWTLKESYIKARGLGLAIPLEQFSFLLDEATPEIGLAIDARLGDDPRVWQIARLPIAPPHALALMIRRGARADLTIHVRELAPFSCARSATPPHTGV